MSIVIIKGVHMGCAVLSVSLFFVRGIWMLTTPQRLRTLWGRVLPHGVDTVLLLSAVTLALMSHQYPGIDNWLTAKVVALLVYIGLGLVAFRFGRSKRTRAIAWATALLVFMYIVAVARSRIVWPF
jgi:uncharacterized membrane protein SirB2